MPARGRREGNEPRRHRRVLLPHHRRIRRSLLGSMHQPQAQLQKSKFFSKLKKLVLGKDKHNRTVSVDRTPPGVGTSDRRASFSNSPSTEYAAARHSCDSFSSSMTEDVEMQVDEQCSSKDGRCKRPSLDLQRLRRINVELREVKGSSCKREVEEGSCSLKSTACEEESPLGSKHSTAAFQEGNHTPEKAELRRYAEVLMGSCGPQKVTRKCKSFSPR
ncbi:hypothetical protein HPP92_003576 [Vanilla planifolia]|uniref:Uncharacterized protein n=1 Tax=Vanilla planifolia TaxID=51239 RepID=A0A835S8C4_VANPL|nr:hypothetical protein HPP92_003959 [Vanilla planifolia]KAG0503504.1 hypothetical protein HPP92_003576 [Vanilla planifolia]